MHCLTPVCDFEKWKLSYYLRHQEDIIVDLEHLVGDLEHLVGDQCVEDNPHHITTETENIIERMDVDYSINNQQLINYKYVQWSSISFSFCIYNFCQNIKHCLTPVCDFE
jgi:hypothetical protein